jgi:aspartyl-tRNA(Asn)/glutamyl-tRNA(Gln) amidotransferase subunit B
MEKDTGKSVHMTLHGEDVTLLDFNRSGVPLVEIVSEPDITSAKQAKEYLNKIQQLVRYIGISDADIEKGSMRCEPTINVKIETNDGQTVYTPLVEIKNVASLTGVMTAIDFEINRQVEEWKSNKITKNDTNKTTRGWDADKNQTFLQREKEGSADYRYFPEPDIPPIEFSQSQIDQIKSTLPELPDAKIAKYKALNLSDYDAKLLAQNSDFASIFEKVLDNSTDSEFAKFITNLLIGPLKTISLDIEKINPIYFKNIFNHKDDLNSNSIKQLTIESYETGVDPLELAKSKNLYQISDTSQIEELVKKIIADNPKVVDDYRKNPQSIGFLIGQVMKVSAGSANPQLAKEILEKLLS